MNATHLVDHVAHPDWIRDGVGNLVGEVHLLSDRVHRLIHLLHFPKTPKQISAVDTTSEWRTYKLLWIPFSASAPFFIASIVSALRLADSIASTWKDGRISCQLGHIWKGVI